MRAEPNLFGLCRMGAGSHEVQGMLRLTFLTCCVLLLTGCGSDESESVGIHDVAYESPVDYDITLTARPASIAT